MTEKGLTAEELAAEFATALPDKEVVSILDLNVDVDVFIDAASPIDLAAAAQLNVAAPIDASAAANVLSSGSGAQAENFQTASVDQVLLADAYAISTQESDIIQADEADGDPAPDPSDDDDGTVEVGNLATLEGPLLNVNVNVDLDADLAAPIAGAVAANANVAAPISASVAANVGTIDSDAIAYSEQEAVITQELQGIASATSNQDSSIDQGTSQPGDSDGSVGTGDAGGTEGGGDTAGSASTSSAGGDSAS